MIFANPARNSVFLSDAHIRRHPGTDKQPGNIAEVD